MQLFIEFFDREIQYNPQMDVNGGNRAGRLDLFYPDGWQVTSQLVDELLNLMRFPCHHQD